jgi:polysaccharide biosynthesis/export protein
MPLVGRTDGPSSMNHTNLSRLLVLALSFAPCALLAEKNQFIDDYWMRSGQKPVGPAQPGPSVRPTPRAAPPAPASSPARAPAPVAQGELVPAIVGLPPTPSPTLAQVYRIAANDLLKIQVFQVDELSSEERVDENGQVVMPLIGPVKVGGLTPKEAQDQIAGILGRDYLQSPQVDVYVKESPSQQVTVMGSVKKPGVFPISGPTTLLQAIALAEGVDLLANDNEVIVFRKDASGNPMAYVVDLSAIQKGEIDDPVLVGSDRVVVPKSGSRAFMKSVADTLRGFVHMPLY